MLTNLFFNLLLSATLGFSYTPSDKHKLAGEKTPQLENVGITEKLGDSIDLTVPVTFDDGTTAPISKAFEGDLPVVFSLVYYSCPSLCNHLLNGLMTSFKQIGLTAGKDFKVVMLSMDHRESSDVASLKKDSYLEEYGKKGVEKGWYFLTASEKNIKKISDPVGFKFKWDDEQKEYAHAAAAIMLTSNRKISRYMHGVGFEPSTLKMSIVEAGKGQVGTVLDQLVSYCFKFNPKLNKYTMQAYNTMQIGGVITIILLLIFIGPVWFREIKKGK